MKGWGSILSCKLSYWNLNRNFWKEKTTCLVGLIINSTEGKIAIELEISRKMPRRYIEIIKKLENQYQNEKWDELIYIVYEKDIDWIEEQLTKQYLRINLSIIKVETILKINQLNQKEK